MTNKDELQDLHDEIAGCFDYELNGKFLMHWHDKTEGMLIDLIQERERTAVKQVLERLKMAPDELKSVGVSTDAVHMVAATFMNAVIDAELEKLEDANKSKEE